MKRGKGYMKGCESLTIDRYNEILDDLKGKMGIN